MRKFSDLPENFLPIPLIPRKVPARPGRYPLGPQNPGSPR